MASSQLAESLARGRVQFQRDGTSTQAERRPGESVMEADGFGHDRAKSIKIEAAVFRGGKYGANK